MNSEREEGDEDAFDFKAKLMQQNRITIPSTIRELKGLAVGDFLKVKVWIHRKAEK